MSEPADSRDTKTFRLRLSPYTYEDARDLAHTFDVSLNKFIADCVADGILKYKTVPGASDALTAMRRARE